jgi:hypothetical protein
VRAARSATTSPARSRCSPSGTPPFADVVRRDGDRLAAPGRRRPLARAHELEAVGYLHMAIQEPLGTGYGGALEVLP